MSKSLTSNKKNISLSKSLQREICSNLNLSNRRYDSFNEDQDHKPSFYFTEAKSDKVPYFEFTSFHKFYPILLSKAKRQGEKNFPRKMIRNRKPREKTNKENMRNRLTENENFNFLNINSDKIRKNVLKNFPKKN